MSRHDKVKKLRSVKPSEARPTTPEERDAQDAVAFVCERAKATGGGAFAVAWGPQGPMLTVASMRALRVQNGAVMIALGMSREGLVIMRDRVAEMLAACVEIDARKAEAAATAEATAAADLGIAGAASSPAPPGIATNAAGSASDGPPTTVITLVDGGDA